MINKEKITTILLMLLVIISLSLFLMLNKNNELHQLDIDKLKLTNISLLQRNDSLNLINTKLTNDIKILISEVDSINTNITKTKIKIKKIKDEKIKIINRFSNLYADSIALHLSNQISKRK